MSRVEAIMASTTHSHSPESRNVRVKGYFEKSRIFEDEFVPNRSSEDTTLRVELQASYDASQLPEVPSEETRKTLNDLLLRIRLKAK
jgi:hypothetical protein